MGIAELEDSATPCLSQIVHLKEAKKHCCLQNICGAIPISQSFFSFAYGSPYLFPGRQLDTLLDLVLLSALPLILLPFLAVPS